MSNRPSICWKCVHREDCKLFNKNPEAKVTECGRFLMKDGDRAIMQMLYKHFMEESEDQKVRIRNEQTSR